MDVIRTLLYVALAWAIFLLVLSLLLIPLAHLVTGGVPQLLVALFLLVVLMSFARASFAMTVEMLAGHYARRPSAQ